MRFDRTQPSVISNKDIKKYYRLTINSLIGRTDATEG